MARPIQPPDPWARPPRRRDKKRRWPWAVGIGVLGLCGLSVLGAVIEDESEPARFIPATSTARVDRSPTTAIHSTIAPRETTAVIVPPPVATVTTTVGRPTVAVPTTTVAPPPPPTTVARPPTTTVAPPPPTTSAYAPPPARVPEPDVPSPDEVYYKNCDAARAAGAAPLHRGEPGYRQDLDGDNDGVACERR
ncbi:excalibur calcium-binding domain-containing protein [Nocardia sp. JW2]|uniref:excalibur calcium-binding domain-containing protein n=1 Tax=Nocardia sp. JW2 TaxID=3450738 RepID=UPI003F4314CB